MFLKKEDNGNYYIYYFRPNGKRTRISTKSSIKSEAYKFLANFETELKKQQSSDTIPISLNKFLFEYLKHSESIHSWNTTLSIKNSNILSHKDLCNLRPKYSMKKFWFLSFQFMVICKRL